MFRVEFYAIWRSILLDKAVRSLLTEELIEEMDKTKDIHKILMFARKKN